MILRSAYWQQKSIAIILKSLAGDVEPIGGHTFAVARGGEKAVDQIFDRRLGVFDGGACDGVDFGGGGREAGEIEGEAADEGGGIGGGLEGESAAGEAGSGETVEWIFDFRLGIFERGRGDGGEGFEGPVGGVGGAFVDPAFEDGDFGGREAGEFGVGRRHHFLFVGASDAEEGVAVGALAGHDGRSAVALAIRAVLGVEAEFAFAAGLVGAVAVETFVRENRAHLTREVDGLGRRGGGRCRVGGGDGERHDEKGEATSEGSERKHGVIG